MSPSAFLIFWTLGSEILRVFAIAPPVWPASTSFFTSARVASVMTALRRRFAGAFFLEAFLPAGRPAFFFLRLPPAGLGPNAALTAFVKARAEPKPYFRG